MSTNTRPELSSKNKYWISRHRYYELRHFCMQYNDWKKLYNSIDGYASRSDNASSNKGIGDPTAINAEQRIIYKYKMDMVDRIADATDRVLGSYILLGVTTGLSYAQLNARLSVPCSKDVYYDLYRRFFWLLDKERR